MDKYEYEFTTARGQRMKAVVTKYTEGSDEDCVVFFTPPFVEGREWKFCRGYYLKSIFSNYVRLEASGLRLHTEIPELHIDANSMIRLFDWMESL